VNLVFAMGLVGGPLVVWLMYRAWRRPGRHGPERRFWLALVPFCVVLGVATVGERDTFGLAHATLLSLEVLGLSLLASAFPFRRAAAVALVAGCAIDFSLGVFLQARIENLENTPGQRIFAEMTLTPAGYGMEGPGPKSLSDLAQQNWYLKHMADRPVKWLEEIAGHENVPGAAPIARELRGILVHDAEQWYGWFSRNDGSVGFLGDRLAGPSFAGLDAQSAILLLLFLGVAWALWKEASRSVPKTAAPVRPHVRAAQHRRASRAANRAR
jgi:hypothetical protein